MKFCIILGTRPEIIKLSPVIRELAKRSVDHFIIHTNQHYSKQMDMIFFKELKLKQPKYNLDVGSGTHGEQTGKMIIGIEKILKKERPDHIIVQGDTNTVIAGAMAAAKELSIKISHVEAGLRSYDRTMPEEINRIIADHISDYLFAPTKTEQAILIQEGIPRDNIHVVGNTIVDAVMQNIDIANTQKSVLKEFQLKKNNYFLLTLHRPSNVDNSRTLKNIFESINTLSKEYNTKTIFPCHPRTLKQIKKFKISIGAHIKYVEPLGYLKMLKLLQNARLVFTDSGGIQEEACILRTPCVTLRYNTERPDTLEVGGNILAGNEKKQINKATQEILSRQINWYNPFGDGTSGKKIIKILINQALAKKSLKKYRKE